MSEKAKTVFLSHPYQDNPEKNIVSACRYAHFAVKSGLLPLVPHLLFMYLTEADRAIILQLCKQLVAISDLFWICGKKVSLGMTDEILEAESLGKPVQVCIFDPDALSFILLTPERGLLKRDL